VAVSDHGRIPADVLRRYEAVHAAEPEFTTAELRN
jgi:hypothetical protein